MKTLETFVASYIETALWSSTDNADDSGGEPLDRNYDEDDIAPDSLSSMKADCEAFIRDAGDLMDGASFISAGHDFWLTRNGHGAGFWDRDPSTYPADPKGKALTALSKTYGTSDLYVGDDGLLYVS